MKRFSTRFKMVILLCSLAFAAHGQASTASARPLKIGGVDHVLHTQTEKRSLGSVLTQLEQEYKVSFFYKTEVVDKKWVDEALILKKQKQYSAIIK